MLHNIENFITLKLSEKAETGNAGEQPVRNIRIDGNSKVVGSDMTSHFIIIFVFYPLKTHTIFLYQLSIFR